MICAIPAADSKKLLDVRHPKRKRKRTALTETRPPQKAAEVHKLVQKTLKRISRPYNI